MAAMEPAPEERDDRHVFRAGRAGGRVAAMEPAPEERDDLALLVEREPHAHAAMEPLLKSGMTGRPTGG